MSRKECTVVLNTSIGSDGERSECGSPEDSVSPPTTPTSVSSKSFSHDSMVKASRDFAQNLKFSIDNILRPDFGPNGPAPKRHHYINSNVGTNSRSSSAFSPPGSVGSQTPAPHNLWPAWVYCTRYSDRPSSGPRCRRVKRKAKAEEKRPRTAFTAEQLARLKKEFQENRYLTEKRRQELSNELGLNESQIKIWFQNKRAKIKKQTGSRNALAFHLLAQGLYNHATVPVGGGSPSTDDEEMKDDDDDVDE